MIRSKRTAISLAGLASAALVAAAAAAAAPVRAEGRAPDPDYASSIKIDGKHHHGGSEQEEAARYADLAKIDAAQAIAAAQGRVPGKVLSAMLDNENGNLVYSVLVQPSQDGGAMQDVKIDAGNGAVLKTTMSNGREKHDHEHEEDDEQD